MFGRLLSVLLSTAVLLSVIITPGESSWLRRNSKLKPKSRSSPSTVSSAVNQAQGIVGVRESRNQFQYRAACSGVSQQATCWCGEGAERRQTIVDVKECPYTTAWGLQCEPCMSVEMLCQTLEHCASCSQDNPNAICATCPPDRHGLHCEKEMPCKIPNITSEHMTVHPYFTKKNMYKLEYRCSGGRVREGPRTLRCKGDTWNKEPPHCVLPKLCSTPPTSPFNYTRVKKDSRTSEHVVYECAAGYRANGSVLETLFHCRNGEWVQRGASIQCERIPGCTTLPTYTGTHLKDDTQVKSVYLTGEALVYECEDSFRPMSDSGANFTLVCSGEQWHGPVPQCELRGCRKLTVEHGVATYSRGGGGSNSSLQEEEYLPLNTRANITCQQDFTEDYPRTTTCSQTGEWVPSPPKCIPKVCTDRQRGQMCSLNVTSDTVVPDTNKTELFPGEVVKFKCKENHYHRMNAGQTERVCINNGSLSGSEIECNKVFSCKIQVPHGDPHIAYCRGRDCAQNRRDRLREKTYVFPSDVVPSPGYVEFFCKNKYYCVDGSRSVQCPLRVFGHVINAPTCKPRCGIRRKSKLPLIVGGTASYIEEWPWQTALMQVRWKQVEFTCGATLIDDRWAVTAAHCVTSKNSTKVRDAEHLRLTYGLTSSNAAITHAGRHNEDKYKVADIIVHDHYDSHSLDNDIALLKLATPVEIGYHVGVACLPMDDRHLMGGEEGKVTGWGRIEMKNLSEELRELPLTVVNASQCKEYYKNEGINGVVITDGMFCAMSNSTHQDTTGGDSGGPFVIQDEDDRWVLEGIVSWGPSDTGQSDSGVNSKAHVRLSSGPPLIKICPGSACFGGYTRVAKYVQWIHEKTNGEVTSERCA
ncbi:uncharacterized protein LOC143299720 [Babylonia areolata]|uniref:uncharacterized protein LOC143299720 n=1 Tax=Babylonia areolata TaxID=304850 RepID=UPI003FD0FDE2